MKSGSNRSKPAATAVCLVNKLPARIVASATSNGCAVSRMKLRARSSTSRNEDGAVCVPNHALSDAAEHAREPRAPVTPNDDDIGAPTLRALHDLCVGRPFVDEHLGHLAPYARDVLSYGSVGSL